MDNFAIMSSINKQMVMFRDLGLMDYKTAWDYQEELLQKNIQIKSVGSRSTGVHDQLAGNEGGLSIANGTLVTDSCGPTANHLLFVEHPPVFTLGKSGNPEHILIDEEEMNRRNIQFYKTNRGGDITFHGLQQLVGYPILDLENFYTDIGRYMRNIEEIIIRTLADYHLKGERSYGETGVWLEPGITGRERKICAIGVRCSRWITMHGFAFNVNTDLSYFNHIIPCGIRNKQVTSLENELGTKISFEEVKEKVKRNFEDVFEVELIY